MDAIAKYLEGHNLNKRAIKALNLFWAGFVLYTICYTLIISAVPLSASIFKKLVYLQLLGAIMFILPAIYLIQFKIENGYLRLIYIIYFGWLFFIVWRGFKFNKEYLFTTFIDSYSGILLYLAPLILLFPGYLRHLKIIVKVILILSVFYVLFDIVFIKALLSADGEEGKSVIEYFSKILAIPCGFILLTIFYQADNRKTWALAGKLWPLFTIVFACLFSLIRARRGLTFISANILIFAYIINVHAYKKNLFIKFFPLVVAFFLFAYGVNKSANKNLGSFRLLKERLTEDTRSGVEEYFYLDMKENDWLIGRGINASYYCPSGATEDGFRGTIETDYLQLILRGGIVSLGLLLLIVIPALILGFFYSKNLISKVAASWILLWAIASYPANVSVFTLNYLLVWISIGICYSKKVRKMPEEAVKEIFQYSFFKRSPG